MELVAVQERIPGNPSLESFLYSPLSVAPFRGKRYIRSRILII